jgi:D-galactonate transporter
MTVLTLIDITPETSMNTHVARAPGTQPALPSAGSVDALYSKVSWRIIPLLIVCYIVAYLDRINIGYAQLQMKQSLSFGDAVYGLGAGIFFIGYFLFEVPSNLMLEKIGARKTLLRIMFCWGLVAAAMMFVQTPTQFYVLRFLLGVFEAGFFPGIILYLTFWYPSARRGQMIAIFMAATTVASVIAGPLCGGIMKYLDGAHGLAGWQWLFLVQGLPATLLGVVAYFYLQDKPQDARWLSASEKHLLQTNLDNDPRNVASGSHASLGHMLRDRKVYVLALVYFLLLGATYTMVFWVPTLIKSWGVADLMQIGLYAALPSLIGVVGMILIGRHSDKHHERRWHFAASVGIAALGLALTTVTQGHLGASMAALSLAVIGIASATPLFFTITTEYLSKVGAAAGIALVSSLGNLGAAASPAVTGAITAKTGSPVYSMYLVIVLYLLSGVILLLAVRSAKAPKRVHA